MKQSANKTEDSSYSADDRLHFVHYVTDKNGNKVATVTGPLKVEFRMQDLTQLVAGACVMAMPIALTEEVWNLEQLSPSGIQCCSYAFRYYRCADLFGVFFTANRWSNIIAILSNALCPPILPHLV